MSHPLSIYLNDHLAGSVAALEMIDHLTSENDETSLRAFLSALRTEVEADQETLKQIIAAVGANESVARQAVAWTMEKVTRLKLGVSDAHDYGLLQALEALLLGITGKRALWEVLFSLQSTTDSLYGFNLSGLIERAHAQAESVNDRRLALALEIMDAPLSAPSR